MSGAHREQNAQKAVAELGLDGSVEKVEGVEEVESSVGFTPALAVNGRVRSSGKVLTVEEIKDLLRS